MHSALTALLVQTTEAAGRAASQRSAAETLSASLATVADLRRYAATLKAGAESANDVTVQEVRAAAARVADQLMLVCDLLTDTTGHLIDCRRQVADLVEQNATLNSALTFAAMIGPSTMASAVALSVHKPDAGPVGRA